MRHVKNRWLAAIVAAWLVLPSAHAAVVTYDNSAGVFLWQADQISACFPFVHPVLGNYLDITLPPTQSGAATPSALGREGAPLCIFGGSYQLLLAINCSGDVSIVRSTACTPACILWCAHPAVTFQPGETIGPGESWSSVAHYGSVPSAGFPAVGCALLGQDAYVGLRLQLKSGLHFGWLHLQAIGGWNYRAVAWAWETTPNTPITIPVPCVTIGKPGDINDDGVVNTLDLGILLTSWSIPATAAGCLGAQPCCSDLNGDGVVNTLDLGILLSSWTLKK